MKNLNLIIAASLLAPASLFAANVTWDITPAAIGPGDSAITGGNGTWSLTNGNWTTDGGANNVAWDNTANAGDIAVFGGTAGSVAINNGGSAINAGGVAFSTSGYTLSSATAADTLNFGAALGSISSSALSTSATAVISANMVGTGGASIAANGDLSATGGAAGGNLSLTGDNTGLSGGIAITSGLVRFASQNAAGSNQISLSNGGGIVNTTAAASLTNAIIVSAGGGTIRTYGNTTLTLYGNLSGTGNLNKTDGAVAGSLVLSGDNSAYTGTLNVQEGLLRFDSASAIVASLSLSNATLNTNGSTAGSIANFSLASGSTGSAVLSNNTSIVRTAAVLDINAAAVTISSGTVSTTGNMRLNPSNSSGASSLTVSGGTLSAAGFFLADGSSTNSTLNISGGSLSTPGQLLIATRGTATATLSGTAEVNAAKVWFGHNSATGNGASATLNLDGGTVSTAGFEKPGTQTSTGVLNFNGGTVRATAGNAFFIFGNAGSTALAAGLTNFRTNVRDGGAIFDTNGNNITIGVALRHSDLGGDNAIDGGLTKNGAGTLTLSTANTYTGTTTANAGTLLAANASAFGTGGVTVAGGTLDVGAFTIANVVTGNGGALAGTGSLTNALLLGASGVEIAAGASLTLTGGVTLLDGSSATIDNVGAVTLGGAGVLDLGGHFDGLTGDYAYNLFSNGVTGDFATITGFGGNITGVNFDNATGLLSITAVPEPSTYGLLGAGALAAVAFVRRRRRLA